MLYYFQSLASYWKYRFQKIILRYSSFEAKVHSLQSQIKILVLMTRNGPETILTLAERIWARQPLEWPELKLLVPNPRAGVCTGTSARGKVISWFVLWQSLFALSRTKTKRESLKNENVPVRTSYVLSRIRYVAWNILSKDFSKGE